MIAKFEPRTQATVAAPSFESFLPALEKQFRFACRYVRLADERTDMILEMTAFAFQFYKSLVEQKKYDAIFSTPLGNFAIRSVFAGRRFAGSSSTDITSARTKVLERAAVCGLEVRNKVDHRFKEVSVYDRYHRPSTIAAFNLDFEAWTDSLDNRTREILFAILKGDTTGELAKDFGISPGRVSQIRQELASSWKEFVSDRTRHRFDDLLEALLQQEN